MKTVVDKNVADKTVAEKEFVEGLARGLSVIEAFDPGSPELTLSDLARRTGHSPAATRRSLFTLVALGYVRKVDRRFALTPKMYHLGAANFRTEHIEDGLVAELRGFVDLFGDAASVAVLVDRNVHYIAHRSAGNGLRPVAARGMTYPAHATSMGRVLLAALPGEALAAYLASPLKALTDVTVVDPAAFAAIIGQTRADGFATSVDQLAYGVTSLAVPVRTRAGDVVAAVNTSGYSGRITPRDLVRDRLDPLRQCAGRVGAMFDLYPDLLARLGIADA